MHTEKVTRLIQTLESLNKTTQGGIIFWNTLVLPALTAIFVTHLLDVNKSPGQSISFLAWVLAAIVAAVHIFIVILQFKGSSIDTMLTEYQEKDQSINDIAEKFNTLKTQYNRDLKYFSSQRIATRFGIDALSFAIGNLRNLESNNTEADPSEFKEMLQSIIWPLVVYRETLFDLKAGALWNIAVYGQVETGQLAPITRLCDERIKPRNRQWEPGFGVVGMSFLHNSIKYYSDITKSQDHVSNSKKDRETYKSIIAIPIIPCEEILEPQTPEYSEGKIAQKPIGVLLITSSEEDQFNLDRDAAFLQSHATLVAILLEKIKTHAEHFLVMEQENEQ